MKDYILSFSLLTSTLLAYSMIVLVQNKTTLRAHHSQTATTWESARENARESIRETARDPQSFEPIGAETEVSAPQRATR